MRRVGVLFAGLAGFAGGAAAADMPPPALAPTGQAKYGEDISIEVSLGALRGTATEYVYNMPGNGALVSKLPWKFSSNAMFNAGIAWRPATWLMIGMRGSMNLSNKSRMDDYDFNVPGCPPGGAGTLCHSNHPGTELTTALMGDIYVGLPYRFMDSFEIAPIFGMKSDRFKWQAYDGTANYLPPGQVFTGSGISYQQQWRAPYVGVALKGEWQGVGVDARLTYSNMASGSDRDHHHLRSLLFTDSFPRTNLITAHLGLSYALRPGMVATLGYDYQRWALGKGPTTIADLAFGGGGTIDGPASGGSQTSHMLSIGLRAELGKTGAPSEGATVVEREPADFGGVYAGVSAGFQHSRSTWRTTGLAAPVLPVAATANAAKSSGGGNAVLFAGYNYQSGQYVAGIEADIGRNNLSGYLTGIPGTAGAAALAGSSDSVVMENRSEASLRARFGFALMQSMLVYGTAGVAFGQNVVRATCINMVTWCINGADLGETRSRWASGITGGAGAEWNMSGRWFTRLDYRYTAYSAGSLALFQAAPTDLVNAHVKTANHRANLGLGYRF